jgi:hypothetical protein
VSILLTSCIILDTDEGFLSSFLQSRQGFMINRIMYKRSKLLLSGFPGLFWTLTSPDAFCASLIASRVVGISLFTSPPLRFCIRRLPFVREDILVSDVSAFHLMQYLIRIFNIFEAFSGVDPAPRPLSAGSRSGRRGYENLP